MGHDATSASRWVWRTLAIATLLTVVAMTVTTARVERPDAHAEPHAPAVVGAAAATQPATAPPAAAIARTVSVVRTPLGHPTAYEGALFDAPSAALNAYQRAATIINAASDCDLDWKVLAAIGRIESDHGQWGVDGGHQVSDEGVVTPPLTGPLLNGRSGRSQVPDTDGGRLDGSAQWDAAVGPFALLPTLWSSVAVDADGDHVRNPQDLDDAALAASVVLCAGGVDLGRHGALVKALDAYHRTAGYASTVLELVTRYDTEAASSPPVVPVPTGIALPMPTTPLPSATPSDPPNGDAQADLLPGVDPSSQGKDADRSVREHPLPRDPIRRGGSARPPVPAPAPSPASPPETTGPARPVPDAEPEPSPEPEPASAPAPEPAPEPESTPAPTETKEPDPDVQPTVPGGESDPGAPSSDPTAEPTPASTEPSSSTPPQ